MTVSVRGYIDGVFGTLLYAGTATGAFNVAGDELATAAADALAEKYGVALELVGTEKCFGAVQNGYQDIEQLGVDRWAAIIGAWHLYQQPVCIVDAGTAVTIVWRLVLKKPTGLYELIPAFFLAALVIVVVSLLVRSARASNRESPPTR